MSALDLPAVLETLRAARSGSGEPNTATMTLAVFVDDAAVAAWARERVRAVADKHPSRVILLDATIPEGTYHIGRSSAHGDWLELGVAGAAPDRLISMLETGSLPEAPMLLMWGGRQTASDQRFEPLARLARTTICSTSMIETDAAALRDLGLFVQRQPSVTVADLAYLRLAPWQECIAGFFDDPAEAAELARLEEIEIACGSDAESYYLACWLASRLGWSVAGPRTFSSERGSVELSIERSGPARRMQRVTLHSSKGRFVAEVGHEDPDAIILETTIGGTGRRRCGPLGGVDIASLVERAILEGEGDRVFRDALAVATQLLTFGAPRS